MSEHAATPPVDPAAFAAIIGGTGFADLHIELVGMFLAESTSVLADLGRALDSGDRDSARRLGHRVKGSAAAVAAAEASLAAAKIEAEAMTTELTSLVEYLDHLRTCVTAVRLWHDSAIGPAG